MIKEKDALLSDYRTLGIGKVDYSETKTRLKMAQISVGYTIILAKAAHSMRFNPKDAWESIHVLYGGDTIHLAFSTVMWMRLPNGELATTDAENASIFGPHFHRVFNNHRLIDWPM